MRVNKLGLFSIASGWIPEESLISFRIERGKKNGIDNRGCVHPSGVQIKVVTEIRSSSKEKLPEINKPYK